MLWFLGLLYFLLVAVLFFRHMSYGNAGKNVEGNRCQKSTVLFRAALAHIDIEKCGTFLIPLSLRHRYNQCLFLAMVRDPERISKDYCITLGGIMHGGLVESLACVR